MCCVNRATLKMSELTQLDSGKSTMRYLPPKGMDDTERTAVRTLSALLAPPAMIIAKSLISCLAFFHLYLNFSILHLSITTFRRWGQSDHGNRFLTCRG